MKLKFPRRRELLPLLFLAVALSFWGQATWIYAKAQLAQVLIARAWHLNLAAPHLQHKPWQWADTWPVLRLQWHGADAGSEDVYVLAGADGSSLAFGPGLLSGSVEAGGGLKVIAAHRDTHFAFLEQLQTGANVSLQDATGKSQTYVVAETIVVDTRTAPLYVDPSVDGLLLITCYPFRALNAGGPLRYLVKAYPAATEADALPVLAKVD
jgi:sortase A